MYFRHAPPLLVSKGVNLAHLDDDFMPMDNKLGYIMNNYIMNYIVNGVTLSLSSPGLMVL